MIKEDISNDAQEEKMRYTVRNSDTTSSNGDDDSPATVMRTKTHKMPSRIIMSERIFKF